jgi:multiple sugar transport system substrate-binding protein
VRGSTAVVDLPKRRRGKLLSALEQAGMPRRGRPAQYDSASQSLEPCSLRGDAGARRRIPPTTLTPTTEEGMANDDRSGAWRPSATVVAGGSRCRGAGRHSRRGQLASPHAQGAVRLEEVQGEKIEIFLVKSPRGDLLTKYHKEFEDLTGITVNSEMIPSSNSGRKAVIEFNSGNTSFDVIAISYHVQKRLFGKNKWLEDIRPMMADKSLADPNLDFADFAKGGLTYATQADGRIDSLPLNLDPWVVYYNKELFAAKNIAYPKTFAEMVDAAARSTIRRRASADSSRAGSRTRTCPCGRASSRQRRRVRRRQRQAHDGDARGHRRREDVPDAAGEVRTAGCRRVQLERSAEPVPAGQGAMWLDGIGFAQPLEDPTKSRIVGKVGYGVMPAGPKQQVSALFGDGEGISTYSKKKGPSWFYLQWASNKANQTRVLQAAAGAPVRNSAYAAAQSSSDFKAPKNGSSAC